MMPTALERFVTFQKTEMCKKSIYRLCNVKRLQQDIKSCCNQGFGAGAKEQSIFPGAGATFKIQAKQDLEPEPDVYRTAPAPKLFLRCYFY